jgi:tetratricopeptide (TPR) repeat protein
LLIVSSCSIKKKKDSSFISNVSTRYNILYNSKLLLQQGIKNTEESSSDNLQQLLSVFKEPTPNSVSQNEALMDSLLGKADHIIAEKQDSKYVDLAFLLKGKASYFKGDYFSANEFFDYVRKTAEDKPSLQQEARLWLVRSLIQLDNLSEATKYLEEAIVHSEEIKRHNALLFATHTKYLLNKGNKEEAIIQLIKAVDLTKNKKEKRRWQYLVGQLLFEKGEDELAYSYFNKVAKSNDSYEVIFHANLYLMEILNKKDPTVENRVNLLSRLLRDGKNKNYKGQIYQRIGDTYQIDQQFEQAIEHYELANNNTLNNPFQQALNYQKLAELYFDQGEYSKSSFYYDSTLLALPKEDPAYDQLSRKQIHLDSLVKQLTSIAYQDSLIMLSSLSAEERTIIIEEIIARNQANTPKTKTIIKNKQQHTIESNNFLPQAGGNSSFYFSSPIAISQGFSDFKKRWGNRAAGDNWRYSSQPTNISSSEAEVSLLNKEIEILENSTLNLQSRYLENLPDTPEKLQLAEGTIMTAYLTLGEIYQNDLQNDESAIKTYETYLHRFPNSENSALLYFHLHRLYTDRSSEKASFYKEKLIKEFPSSKYSLVLSDPDYYKKQHDLLQNFNEHYNAAYNLFSSRKYEELIQQTEEIIQNKTFSSLENNMAQLAYLYAISIGRTADINAFKTALQSLVNDYPEEAIVVPLVKQHLNYIDTNKAQFQNKAIALDDLNPNIASFEKEFALTPWPELSYSKEYNIHIVRNNYDVEQGKVGLTVSENTLKRTALGNKSIDIGEVTIIGHENSYRDLKLFPDSANYLFVINVMHGSVNLSPSRYGIGQFNRAQYPTETITHQLKNISDENQLLYIGVFSTFAEAKAYEAKIKPLLSSIMKIPEDLYASFLVTDSVFNTFANFEQLEDYFTIYQTQK